MITKEQVIKDLNEYDMYLGINKVGINSTPSIEIKKTFKQMFGYELILHENGFIQIKNDNN